MSNSSKGGASRTEDAPRRLERLDVACDFLKRHGFNEEARLLKTAGGMAELLQIKPAEPGCYRATIWGLMRMGGDHEPHLQITEFKLEPDHEPPR